MEVISKQVEEKIGRPDTKKKSIRRHRQYLAIETLEVAVGNVSRGANHQQIVQTMFFYIKFSGISYVFQVLLIFPEFSQFSLIFFPIFPEFLQV